MGWEVGGRFQSQETYVDLWLNHVDVRQKPTQYCKAIILQLTIKKKKKKDGPVLGGEQSGAWNSALLPPICTPQGGWRGSREPLQGLRGVSYREESLSQTSTKTTLTPKQRRLRRRPNFSLELPITRGRVEKHFEGCSAHLFHPR